MGAHHGSKHLGTIAEHYHSHLIRDVRIQDCSKITDNLRCEDTQANEEVTGDRNKFIARVIFRANKVITTQNLVFLERFLNLNHSLKKWRIKEDNHDQCTAGNRYS